MAIVELLVLLVVVVPVVVAIERNHRLAGSVPFVSPGVDRDSEAVWAQGVLVRELSQAPVVEKARPVAPSRSSVVLNEPRPLLRHAL